MLERRSLTDRRSGVDRRQNPPDSPVSLVWAAVHGERRVGERRSGVDRRQAKPAARRVRRR
jgi:hypothetical protein